MLGSPVGDIDCISAVLEEKIGMLKTMGERLKYLFSHDAILLLRHSFAIPKLLYNLRTSPCFLSPKLQEYDNLLRSIVSSIVNIRFGEDDPAWTQATLPSVKSGGLGIRSAVQLAPSAYMASAAACSELVSIVLPPQLQDFTASAYLDEAIGPSGPVAMICPLLKVLVNNFRRHGMQYVSPRSKTSCYRMLQMRDHELVCWLRRLGSQEYG